jgi:hypothetical protein
MGISCRPSIFRHDDFGDDEVRRFSSDNFEAGFGAGGFIQEIRSVPESFKDQGAIVSIVVDDKNSEHWQKTNRSVEAGE